MGYVYKAGVVGGGLMGSGIAQVVTYAGLPVVLKEVTPELTQKAVAGVRQVYEERVRKGKMTAEQLEQKMQLVAGTTQWGDFADVDLVIEAVPEDLELKKKVFAELGKACPEGAILASNTSALSITEMGKASGRPDRVLGLHFFYPAPVMKLVEVIPTEATSPETLDTATSFVESLRKLPVRVKECAGFLVNRLLMPYVGEAIRCLEAGIGDKKKIDDAMVAFGMPMGPFLLADTLGLDVCYKVALVLEAAYGERARPPATLKELYERKRYGQKTGAGFYSYSDQPEYVPAVRKPEAGSFTAERLLYPMANEAAHCLQEGVASPGDIDLAMLAGTGFPQAKGGLLRYADEAGLDKVVASLRSWDRPVCPLLDDMVKSGKTGKTAKRGFFEYT